MSLERARALLERGTSVGRDWNLLHEAYLLAGRLSDAREAAAHGLALSCQRKERGIEAWALRLHADILASDTPLDVDAAEGFYHRGLLLATKLGMRPLVAHCHLSLGRLDLRTKRREQAHEYLATATTMYRETG
jgi:hypothetical protein